MEQHGPWRASTSAGRPPFEGEASHERYDPYYQSGVPVKDSGLIARQEAGAGGVDLPPLALGLLGFGKNALVREGAERKTVEKRANKAA
jgi:hypothetical protein